MKIKYDNETDTLYIQFNNNPIIESDSDKPGIILDYDNTDTIVGIEVLNVSKKMDRLSQAEYMLI
jgi:uncharacterized protein YuzE